MGNCIARELVRCGAAAVIAVDMDNEKLQELKNEVSEYGVLVIASVYLSLSSTINERSDFSSACRMAPCYD